MRWVGMDWTDTQAQSGSRGWRGLSSGGFRSAAAGIGGLLPWGRAAPELAFIELGFLHLYTNHIMHLGTPAGRSHGVLLKVRLTLSLVRG
jgi:hypothetical protein